MADFSWLVEVGWDSSGRIRNIHQEIDYQHKLNIITNWKFSEFYLSEISDLFEKFLFLFWKSHFINCIQLMRSFGEVLWELFWTDLDAQRIFQCSLWNVEGSKSILAFWLSVSGIVSQDDYFRLALYLIRSQTDMLCSIILRLIN